MKHFKLVLMFFAFVAVFSRAGAFDSRVLVPPTATAMYMFDGNLADSSGNSYHGSSKQVLSFVKDRFNAPSYAVHFSGKDMMKIPVSSKDMLGENWSLSAWVKLDRYDSVATIATNFNTNNDFKLNFKFWVDSKGYLVLALQNSKNPDTLRSETTVPLNRWTQVGVIKNGATFAIYKNGIMDASIDLQSYVNSMPTDSVLTVGNDLHDAKSGFTGSLDDLIFYYSSGANMPTQYGAGNWSELMNGLVLELPMDGNANDISGNKLHGKVDTNVTPALDRYSISGRAMKLPGGAISVPGFGDNCPLQGISVSMWVKFDSKNKKVPLFRLSSKTNPDYFVSAYISNDTVNSITWVYGNYQTGNCDIECVFKPGWNHIVLLADSGSYSVSINGNLFACPSGPAGFANVSTNPFAGQELIIGGSTEVSDFKGVIDDFRVFDRILDENDITALSKVCKYLQQLQVQDNQDRVTCTGVPNVIKSTLLSDNGSGAQPTIEWSTGEKTQTITVTPQNTSIYYATYSYTDNCMNKDSITLEVLKPVVTISADSLYKTVQGKLDNVLLTPMVSTGEYSENFSRKQLGSEWHNNPLTGWKLSNGKLETFNDYSEITLNITIKEEAKLLFTVSENKMKPIELIIDGDSQEFLVSNNGMQTFQVQISPGKHTLKWIYRGDDYSKATLDDITFLKSFYTTSEIIYSWLKDGEIQENNDETNLITPEQHGSYSVIATLLGCKDTSNTIAVMFNKQIVEESDTITGCGSLERNGIIYGASMSIEEIKHDTLGYDSVIVQVYFDIYPLPSLSYTANPMEACPGDTVMVSLQPDNTNITWEPFVPQPEETEGKLKIVAGQKYTTKLTDTNTGCTSKFSFADSNLLAFHKLDTSYTYDTTKQLNIIVFDNENNLWAVACQSNYTVITELYTLLKRKNEQWIPVYDFEEKVYSLFFDKTNVLWVVTNNKVYRYEAGYMKLKFVDNSLYDTHKAKIVQDASGRVWILFEQNEGYTSKLMFLSADVNNENIQVKVDGKIYNYIRDIEIDASGSLHVLANNGSNTFILKADQDLLSWEIVAVVPLLTGDFAFDANGRIFYASKNDGDSQGFSVNMINTQQEQQVIYAGEYIFNPPLFIDRNNKLNFFVTTTDATTETKLLHGDNLGMKEIQVPGSGITMGADTSGMLYAAVNHNLMQISTPLLVNNKPWVSVYVSNDMVCPGSSVILSLDANVTNVKWHDDSIPNKPKQEMQLQQTTTYIATATNSFGCSLSDTAVVEVPNLVITSSKTTICPGETVTLTATGSKSYQWTTGDNTAIINVSPKTTTSYTVMSRTPEGCNLSQTVTVYVNPLPDSTIIPSNLSVCVGDSVTLTAKESSATYIWNTGSTSNEVKAKISRDSVFSVSVKNDDGCTSKGSISIRTYKLLDPIRDTFIEICKDQNGVVQASGASLYVWDDKSTSERRSFVAQTSTYYHVTATSAEGCKTIDSIQINVLPLPTVTLSASSNSVCPGIQDTLSITSSGTTFTWEDNSTSSVKTRYVKPTFTQLYRVTATGANGCFDTASIKITTFNNFFAFEIGMDQNPICQGDSTRLYVGGSAFNPKLFTYLWSTGSTTEKIYVTPKWNTTYSLTIKDTNGCRYNYTDKLMVGTLPTYKKSPADTICPGDTSMLFVNTLNTDDSFFWSTGKRTSSIDVIPQSTTTYYVAITSSSGCSVTDSIAVKVRDVQPVSITLSQPVICQGQAVDLTASSAVSYVWKTGATTPSITVKPTDTTTYTVVGTDMYGCETKASATIAVRPKPAPIAISDKTIEQFSDIPQFKANTIATWLSHASPTVVDSIYRPFISTSTKDTYQYRVFQTIAGCSSDSVTFSLTVVDCTPPSLSVTSANTVCGAGNPVILSASGASSYTWSETNVDTNAITVLPATTTTYRVTGTDAKGCPATASVTVTVNPLPKLALSSISILCQGDSLQLQATGATSYAWSTGTGATPWVKPLSSTTYHVTGTSANTCQSTDSIMVTVKAKPSVIKIRDTAIAIYSQVPTFDAGLSALWLEDQSKTVMARTFTPTVDATVEGEYTYKVFQSAAGCSSDTNSFKLTVSTCVPSPLSITPSRTTVCGPNDTVLLVASSASAYRWNVGGFTSSSIKVNPKNTTTYKVTGTDAKGCPAIASVTVTVNPLPTLAITSLSTLCQGDSLQLQAVGAASYAWSTGTGATPWVKPLSSTTYHVTGTSANTCQSIDSIKVTVIVKPSVIHIRDTAIAIYSQVPTFDAGLSALWLDESSKIVMARTFTPTVDATVEGEYAFRVFQSVAGCSSDTSSFKLTVRTCVPSPLSITPSRTTVCGSNDTVSLVASSAMSYRWSVGDSTSSSIKVNPRTTTTYKVTGTDAKGCPAIASVTVTVNPLPTVTITSLSTLCQGDSLQLQATGAVSYAWSTGTGAMPWVKPLSSTTYYVTGTSTNTCQSTDSIMVTVKAKPSVITIRDTAIYTFSQIPTFDAGLSALWLEDVSKTVVARTFRPTVDATVAGEYTYKVFQSVAGCSSDTSSFTLSIVDCQKPDVSISASQTTVCSGTTVTLTARGARTYAWNTSEKSSVLTVSPQQSQTFIVTGVDSKGCSNIASVLVSVKPNPEVVITSATSLCKGDSLQLTASGAASYSWGTYVDSSFVSPSEKTTYSVTGTGSNGCIATTSFQVLVHNLPDLKISISNDSICRGDSVTINATTNGTRINWSNTTAHSLNQTVRPSESSVYYATAYTLQNCATTTSVSVVVNPKPVISITTANTGVCVGQSVTLVASGGVSYQWGSSQGERLVAVPGIDTTFHVKGTNQFGCSSDASASITVYEGNTVSVIDTVCGSSVVYDKDVITSDTTFTKKFSTINGCDSVVTYTIVLKQRSTLERNDSVCLLSTMQLKLTDNGVSESLIVIDEKEPTVRQDTMAGFCGAVNVLKTIFTTPLIKASTQKICYGTHFKGITKSGTYDIVDTKQCAIQRVTVEVQLSPITLYDTLLVAKDGNVQMPDGRVISKTGSDTSRISSRLGCDSIIWVTTILDAEALSKYLKFEHSNVRMEVGSEYINVLSVMPQGIVDVRTIRWASTDTSVAIVHSIGHVVARAPGKTKILAMMAGGRQVSAWFDVEVYEVLDTRPLLSEIEKAQSLLTAISANKLVGDSLGQYAQSSIDSLVAAKASAEQVLASQNLTNAVVATQTQDMKRAIYRLLVSQAGAVSVASISVYPDTLAISVFDDNHALTAKVMPVNTTVKDVTWKTLDPAIFRVNENGDITPISEGKALAVATSVTNPLIADTSVVIVRHRSSVINAPTILTLPLGDSLDIASLIYSDAKKVDGYTFSSDDSSVIVVDSLGILVAVGIGSANVLVETKDGGTRVVVPVNVVNHSVKVTGVAVIDTMVTIVNGQTTHLVGSLVPINATNNALRWTTADKNVAVVSPLGELLGVSQGSTYIYLSTTDGMFKDSALVTVIPSAMPVVTTDASVTMSSKKDSLVLDLASYLTDDNTSVTDMVVTMPQPSFRFRTTIRNGKIITKPIDPSWTGTDTLKLVVVDKNNQRVVVPVVVSVSSRPNTAPVIATMRGQRVLVGDQFDFFSLKPYVTDDYTPTTNITWACSSTNHIAGLVFGGGLQIVILDNDWIGTDTLTLTAYDEDSLFSSVRLPFSVSRESNTPPVIVSLPDVTFLKGIQSKQIDLNKYVVDDYSIPEKILWTVSASSKMSVVIKKNVATITLIDPNWVGNESLYFTAIDAGGLIDVDTLDVANMYSLSPTWLSRPRVNFSAQRTVVAPGQNVFFNASIYGATSWAWSIEKSSVLESNDLNPVVTYKKPGSYSVKLLAQNDDQLDSLVKNKYITAIGIKDRDITICKGAQTSIGVSDSIGYTFKWSTGQSRSLITVSPAQNTWYKVVISQGLFVYPDSVYIIVKQPISLGGDTALCSGEKMLIDAGAFSSYKWSGPLVAQTRSIMPQKTGIYTVRVTDDNNCQWTDSKFVEFYPLPHIDLGNDDTICMNTKFKMDAGQVAHYLWSTGDTTRRVSIVATNTQRYSVTVTDTNSCKNSDSILIEVLRPYADQIALVTHSDSIPDRVVVAWQKTLHKRTLKYEVYRETGEADDFGYKIGERYFNQKSFVVDTTARFAEKSYRYRLTTIDSTCFNEAVSRVHKTIHLQTFLTQDNGVGLRWNPYQGLPIRSYLVYRIEPDGTSREIKRIARDSIVMTFTDYSPGNSVARYRVGYILPKTIYIDSLLKSDSGPYSLSLSNLAESKIALDVPVQQDDDVSILPNPASTYVTISIKDIPARMVTIVNRLGEVVTRFDVSRDVNSLLLVDVSLFSSGVYTIVIESDKQSVARKLIVE